MHGARTQSGSRFRLRRCYRTGGVSNHPVLPVKLLGSPDEAVGWMGKDSNGTQRTRRAKVTPGGRTIPDAVLQAERQKR
jgi:hypothetical protein